MQINPKKFNIKIQIWILIYNIKITIVNLVKLIIKAATINNYNTIYFSNNYKINIM